jgi:hypothetical protein
MFTQILSGLIHFFSMAFIFTWVRFTWGWVKGKKWFIHLEKHQESIPGTSKPGGTWRKWNHWEQMIKPNQSPGSRCPEHNQKRQNVLEKGK